MLEAETNRLLALTGRIWNWESTSQAGAVDDAGLEELLRETASVAAELAYSANQMHSSSAPRVQKLTSELADSLQLLSRSAPTSRHGEVLALSRALRSVLTSAASRDPENIELATASRLAADLRSRYRRTGPRSDDPIVFELDAAFGRLTFATQPLDGYDPHLLPVLRAAAAAFEVLRLMHAPEIGRVPEIDNRTTNEVLNAFESPFRALTDAALDGLLDPDQEHFVSTTLQQLALERTKGSTDPRIIELLIADLIRVVNGHLHDRQRFEDEFIRLGSDPGTAAVAADRVAQAIQAMTTLGGADPVVDAETLAEIAEVADALDEALANEKEDGAGIGKTLVESASAEVGKESVRAVRTLIEEHWTLIATGLIYAWRTVKGWIV